MMRLAFWRAGNGNPLLQRLMSRPAKALPPSPRPAPSAVSAPATGSGDLDLRALGHALMRKRRLIIIPTAIAFVLSLAVVNLVTPRYKSEARILIDGRENIFLRPNGERNEERTALDAEAVTSQVQLLLSRDLAREIIKKNKLAERPEFDPVLHGLSPLKSVLALFGIGRDPFSLTPEERVLDAYFDRFTAYAVDKSRVIVIEFQSQDPDLSARVANSFCSRARGRIRPKPPGNGCRVKSRICARRLRTRNPALRTFVLNRAFLSAPTIPRFRISRWAS
jgi:succinoglycan biosynthesis transport protein ExoP